MANHSELPWDGRVTTEMMHEVCGNNAINLTAFHGNRKVVHQTAHSDTWLSYFFWDDHTYSAKNSRPYVQTPLYTGGTGQNAEMDPDLGGKRQEPQFGD